jgi:hypothetical protein
MLLLGHNFYLEKIPGPTHTMVGALFKEGVDIFLTKFTINLGVATLVLSIGTCIYINLTIFFYKSMLHFPTGIRM